MDLDFEDKGNIILSRLSWPLQGKGKFWGPSKQLDYAPSENEMDSEHWLK